MPARTLPHDSHAQSNEIAPSVCPVPLLSHGTAAGCCAWGIVGTTHRLPGGEAGFGAGGTSNGTIWHNKTHPSAAFEGPWPFFQESFLVLLACTFSWCPRTSLCREMTAPIQPRARENGGPRARVLLNNSASGGGGSDTPPPWTPPSFSGPPANQKFFLAPSAQVSFGQRISSVPLAPLTTQGLLRGGGGCRTPPPHICVCLS